MTAILKGWLVFSEPGHDITPEVRWKKPTADFLKAWKTKAVPVTIRPTRSKRGASR